MNKSGWDDLATGTGAEIFGKIFTSNTGVCARMSGYPVIEANTVTS